MSLTPHLQPSALVGEMPRQVMPQKEAAIELGWPGFCPRQPRLVLPMFDDSGSVSLPGGGDPVGNRYEEAQLAFEALQEWCTCGRCLGGVLHFDTPRGDVDPGKLRSPTFQQHLTRGLRVPRFAAGSSVLGPSLTRAEEIAASFPKHEVRLVVLDGLATVRHRQRARPAAQLPRSSARHRAEHGPSHRSGRREHRRSAGRSRQPTRRSRSCVVR